MFFYGWNKIFEQNATDKEVGENTCIAFAIFCS